MSVYFKDIELHIIKNLALTRERLLVAVAWFTNNNIANTLIELNKQNIEIEIIIDDNKINRNSSCLNNLIQNGISVEFIKGLKKSGLMHDKFCVIDNQKVITGSYNWTKNANINDENIIVNTDPDISNLYSLEFRRLKRKDHQSQQFLIAEDESEKILNHLIQDIKLILRTSVSKNEFKQNAIKNIYNQKVNALIRQSSELITLNLEDKTIRFRVHLNFVDRYGINYKQKVSNEDILFEKDKLYKEGIKDFETGINFMFCSFKIRAIKKVIQAYISLIKKEEKNQPNLDKILKVYMYLNKERIMISESIKY